MKLVIIEGVGKEATIKKYLGSDFEVVATKGHVILENVNPEHISSIISKLEETKAKIYVKENSIELIGSSKIMGIDTIKTMPYPGFPTDMQSQFVSMLTVSKGTSIVTENIFENRFKYVSELIRMGAKINIEGRTVIIKGVKKLEGALIEAHDLRGGAALVIAGLVANGSTKLIGIRHILRGYENLDKKLLALGASIKKGE